MAEDPIIPPLEIDIDATRQTRLLSVAALGLLTIGTVVYKFLEDWSWVDALYYSVVSVTTVGFGDFTPSSDASKLFTVVYLLTGIGLIGAFADARFKRAAERRARARG